MKKRKHIQWQRRLTGRWAASFMGALSYDCKFYIRDGQVIRQNLIRSGLSVNVWRFDFSFGRSVTLHFVRSPKKGSHGKWMLVNVEFIRAEGDLEEAELFAAVATTYDTWLWRFKLDGVFRLDRPRGSRVDQSQRWRHSNLPLRSPVVPECIGC